MTHRPAGIWVTNHVINPILRPLLRSPVGRPLGRHLALIRYTGHRTGRVYQLPVQYASDGARIWILPGSPEHKTWWRNLRKGADVDLLLAGRRTHGHAMVIDQTRQPEFAEGLTAYLRAVPQARRALGMAANASPGPVGTGAWQVPGSAVLVRVDLKE